MLQAVAVAEPEAMTLEPIRMVDSTFATQSAAGTPQTCALAHALGTHATLPRMLRQSGQVRSNVRACAYSVLPAGLQELWLLLVVHTHVDETGSCVPKSRNAACAVQVPVLLLDRQELERVVLDLIVSIHPAAASLHEALYQHWLRQGMPHSHVTACAYSLLASLQPHTAASPLLTLLHTALRGECSGQAVLQVAAALQDVTHLLGEAEMLQLPGITSQGVAPVEDAMQLIHQLLPDRSGEELDAIQACIHACGVNVGGAADNVVAFARLHATHLDMVGDFVAGARLSGHDSDGLSWAGAPGLEHLGGSAPSLDQVQSEHVADAPSTTAAEYQPPQALNGAEDPELQQCMEIPSLVGLVGGQQAQRLLHLHQEVQASAAALAADQPDEQVSLVQLHACLAAVPGLTLGAAHATCCALSQRLRREGCEHCSIAAKTAAIVVACEVPLECAQGVDVGAALAWLQGLQAHAHGHESTAALPEVA